MTTPARWVLVLMGAALLTPGAAPPAVAPGDEPDTPDAPAPEAPGSHRVDFTDFGEGPVEDWLKGKGFDLEYGAQSRKEIGLAADAEGLRLSALRRTRGFFVREGEEVGAFGRVRIEWGVDKYPDGACYSCETFNEAIMVYVFFGTKKLYSGGFGVPNAPYFLGLYLGRGDEQNVAYKGRYYHRGGRFVCVGNPDQEQLTVTEFDLAAAFKQAFGADEVPAITGYAVGVDTTDSGDRGRAAAFIKSLEFLP